MPPPRYPVHKPVRYWRHPLERVCACGLDAWPCPAKQILDRQAELSRQREEQAAQRGAAVERPTATSAAPHLTVIDDKTQSSALIIGPVTELLNSLRAG